MQYHEWIEMRDDVSYALQVVKDIRTRYPNLPVDLNYGVEHVVATLRTMKNDLEENYAWQPKPQS